MPTRRRPWTADDETQLVALYPTVPAETLVGLLGHPLSAVYAKAFDLGLKKTVFRRRSAPWPWPWRTPSTATAAGCSWPASANRSSATAPDSSTTSGPATRSPGVRRSGVAAARRPGRGPNSAFVPAARTGCKAFAGRASERSGRRTAPGAANSVASARQIRSSSPVLMSPPYPAVRLTFRAWAAVPVMSSVLCVPSTVTPPVLRSTQYSPPGGTLIRKVAPNPV